MSGVVLFAALVAGFIGGLVWLRSEFLKEERLSNDWTRMQYERSRQAHPARRTEPYRPKAPLPEHAN